MKIVVSVDMEDFVYHFYRKAAEALGQRPEALMEHALYMYAGMAAQEVVQEQNSENQFS